ncbi:MAG: PEGA domain-containing protein [Fibrobacter sp.]|nr:PEGA domain-containing protein [Fibrobacter sp.]
MLEEAEVFDSNLLKESINNYIASGKRNFAIDLTPLDYIYSDTINVLMALNKRVLDVSGRLALLGPQPEVLQILKRAGIHNILRVFETETDLMKTSEDIILQTSSFKMEDIQAIAESAPHQSEFDQLRSEIGSVFGSHDVPQEPVTQRPRPSAPVPPPPPVHQEPAFGGSFEQEFTAPPQENFSRPSMPPQFAPPSPQMGFGSYPQQPQFQSRQFTPPPSKPPVPQTPAFEPVQKAPQHSFVPPEATNQSDFSSMRPETQRFPTAPVPPLKPMQPHKPEPFITEEADKDLEDFEVPAKKKQKKVRDEFDAGDELFDDEVKKKSPVPMLLLLLLILAAGGAGVYFGLTKMSKKPQAPVATSAPAVSQTPAPSTTPAPEPVAEEKKPEEPPPPPPEPEKPAVVEKKAAPRKTASRPASTPRPAATSTSNQVTITSVPTGATVTINGQRMGTTPFTWSKPAFGQSNIRLTKDGYEESSKTIEFTGGTSRESFTLSKAAYVAPPPPPPSQPVVKAEPKITPPPPAPEPDDFSLPEPEPAAPPPAPAPVVSGGGGDASIFIASIPPVADVYLDGKLMGKTNVSELKLPVGTYTLRFVKGAKEMSKTVTLTAGKNPSQMVRLP